MRAARDGDGWSGVYVRQASLINTSDCERGSGGGGAVQKNGSMAARCCFSFVQLAKPCERATESCAAASVMRASASAARGWNSRTSAMDSGSPASTPKRTPLAILRSRSKEGLFGSGRGGIATSSSHSRRSTHAERGSSGTCEQLDELEVGTSLSADWQRLDALAVSITCGPQRRFFF